MIEHLERIVARELAEVGDGVSFADGRMREDDDGAGEPDAVNDILLVVHRLAEWIVTPHHGIAADRQTMRLVYVPALLVHGEGARALRHRHRVVIGDSHDVVAHVGVGTRDLFGRLAAVSGASPCG